MYSRRMVTWSIVLGLLMSTALVVGANAAPVTNGVFIQQISQRTSMGFPPGSDIPANINGHNIQSPEFPPELAEREGREKQAPNQLSISAASTPLTVPVVKSSKIAASNQGLAKSFEGLNLFQQRFTNQGNQFTVVPPDQGLCVGNGYILETINSVLRVFKTSGAAASFPIDLNTFYGYPAAIDRTNVIFGPSLTDPSCYYDTDTQRWFHVVLTFDIVPKTGAFAGPSHLDIAVSQTSSPLGAWNFYSIPTQNDGTQGTPKHQECPCFGDYPQIGADKYGFYITTNEFLLGDGDGVFGLGFNGAQLYALSKKALTSRASKARVVQFQNLALPKGIPGYTVQPARPSNGNYATENGGTEYLLSSATALVSIENRIGVWALTNTRTLDASKANLKLTRTLVQSQTYGDPSWAEQKIGPVPLRDCLLVGCLAGVGPSSHEVEAPLDSNDSRMLQVSYANGKLWSSLDTIVNVGGNLRSGVAYFIVDPTAGPPAEDVMTDASAPDAAASSTASVQLNAKITRQGYIAIANHSVTYPAVAALDNGKGVIALNVVGDSYYPSAGYVSIDSSGVSDVHIAAVGQAPEDDFCGYVFYNCGDTDPVSSIRPRWGDYGAATTDGNTIWLASEYIAHACTFSEYQADPTCGRTRATLGNWSTRISAVIP